MARRECHARCCHGGGEHNPLFAIFIVGVVTGGKCAGVDEEEMAILLVVARAVELQELN